MTAGNDYWCISQVTPHLFMSGVYPVSTNKWQNLSLTLIINCTKVVSAINRPSTCEYYQLSIDDDLGTDIYQYFGPVCRLIRQHRDKGGRTLVHCTAGISRSSAIVLSYLIFEEKYKLSEAYKLLKSIRLMVHPNRSFWIQLKRWECEVLDKSKLTAGEKTSVFHDNGQNM